MQRFAKLIVAALALSPVVLAQKNACKADEVEIQSDGDVSQLSGCSVIEGSIIVGPDVTTFILPDAKDIKGDFVIEKASDLLTIDAQNLERIRGSFYLRELTILNAMNLPKLAEVGDIDWVTLPALQSINAAIVKADNVKIADTNLLSLAGINLKSTGFFDINNNRFLKNVEVDLVNVTEALTITFNKPGVIASFPKLESARNITFRDAGSISLPSLKKVENSIAFVNNSIENVFLPNLTEVTKGSISFYSNRALTNISAPLLEKVGGTFQIANNTKFEDLDGFPMLAEVGGAVDLAGRFKTGGLPSLEDVRGGFNLQTTEEFDCTEFEDMKDDQVIKGDAFVCSEQLDEAKTKDGAEAGSNGKNGDDKKNAAGQIGISIVSMFGIAVGAVTFLL